MININEIKEILPHRYPFLLIDKIIEMEIGKKIVGIKSVTINEPFFQGHFPNYPIMPGVLIIEALAQAGGVLAIKSRPDISKDCFVYFIGINKAKFRKPVFPGDQLRLELEVIHERAPYWILKGRAYVEDNLACEAELKAMIGEKL